MKKLALSLLLATVVGSATPFVVDHNCVTAKRYPAKAKNAPIKVIYGDASRSHIELAEIWIRPGNVFKDQSAESAVRYMQLRAREIGADAIKIVELKMSSPGFKAHCVAIRWQDGTLQG